MTREQFQNWIHALENAWMNKNPQAAVDLCADSLIWHETPFSPVITTKEELLIEWQSVLNQDDIALRFEILSVNEHEGIARWNAKFTLISTQKKLIYDGIYLVRLNDDGKCFEFQEWFNFKET